MYITTGTSIFLSRVDVMGHYDFVNFSVVTVVAK